jgi:hypothetical protein
MTGVLLQKNDFAYVEWHDGSRQKLRHEVASALTEVNVKERFSAFVKLGKDNEPLAIERVSLLSNVAEDWESWPKKN